MTFITSDRYKGKKFQISELIEKLKIAVSGEKYQIREKFNFGVNVTSIEQTRGIPYLVMILCGAIDGEFPMTYKPETFLGRELKNSVTRHIQAERLQFYQFLTNDTERLNGGEKKIFITYPQNNASEQIVRSSFVEQLLKITTLEDDLKVYDINKVNQTFYNINSSSDTLSKQAGELPWLNLIENDNELFSEAGSLLSEDSSGLEKMNGNLNSYSNPDISKSLEYIHFYIKESGFNNVIPDISTLPEDIKITLMNYKENPISVTDLELYAVCPFKFFIKKIIKVPEPREIGLSLSPLDQGNLMHNILYLFYIGNQAVLYNENKYDYFLKPQSEELPNIIPVVLNRNERGKYLDFLLKLAQRELEFIRYEHPYFKFDE